MKRINKAQARKLYNAGQVVWCVPCKLRMGTPWYPEIMLHKQAYDADFDKIVNAATYYNCTLNETGRYLHYYIAD